MALVMLNKPLRISPGFEALELFELDLVDRIGISSHEPACEVVEPGISLHHQFNRLMIGEPDGSHSNRVMALSKAFSESGIDAPVRDNIRWNTWLKLWGNVCFNPISTLTGATLDRITSEPGLLALCKTMMLEAKAVNEALGIQIPLEMMDRRLAAAGLGGRAQDVNVAGFGAGPKLRDRCIGHGRAGDRAAYRCADSNH